MMAAISQFNKSDIEYRPGAKQQPIVGKSHWCDGKVIVSSLRCSNVVANDHNHCEAGHVNKIRSLAAARVNDLRANPDLYEISDLIDGGVVFGEPASDLVALVDRQPGWAHIIIRHGHASVYFWHNRPKDNYYYFGNLESTTPGSGEGAQLVDALIDHVRKMGANVWIPMPDHPRLVQWYKRNWGFVTTGRGGWKRGLQLPHCP